MLEPKRFAAGFFGATAISGTLFLIIYLFLYKAGELDIDGVVAEQIANPSTLYASGLNQNVYYYKLKLAKDQKPAWLVIGSSRSMQVRGHLFSEVMVNTGGAVNNIADLEGLASEIGKWPRRPSAVLVFVDPWWFNKAYSGKGGPPPQNVPPNEFSLALTYSAISSLTKGNWISEIKTSRNKGIVAILTGEGYSGDGSRHYTASISGRHEGFDDPRFSKTLQRINKGIDKFTKATHPDPVLISRTCVALKRLEKHVDRMMVIAPPFAPSVWKAMSAGGYEYIAEAHREIERCVGTNSFFAFLSESELPNTTDCEFLDGFHGGDVTYARLILEITKRDATMARRFDLMKLRDFVDTNSGLAAAITSRQYKTKEIDFLQIGCAKERS